VVWYGVDEVSRRYRARYVLAGIGRRRARPGMPSCIRVSSPAPQRAVPDPVLMHIRIGPAAVAGLLGNFLVRLESGEDGLAAAVRRERVMWLLVGAPVWAFVTTAVLASTNTCQAPPVPGIGQGGRQPVTTSLRSSCLAARSATKRRW